MILDKPLYKLLRPLIKLFVFIIFRPKIVGRENIPSNGGVVLAGNHTNNLDSILLIMGCKRCIHFLAKDSLNKGIKGCFFRGMGIIPVNRSVHDKDALMRAEEVLNSGCVIGIFPEGTINRTNRVIMPFKIGAVKMAKDTDSIVVPFTIKGRYHIFKNNLILEFYEPYKVSSDLELENNRLMDKIRGELDDEIS